MTTTPQDQDALCAELERVGEQRKQLREILHGTSKRRSALMQELYDTALEGFALGMDYREVSDVAQLTRPPVWEWETAARADKALPETSRSLREVNNHLTDLGAKRKAAEARYESVNEELQRLVNQAVAAGVPKKRIARLAQVMPQTVAKWIGEKTSWNQSRSKKR